QFGRDGLSRASDLPVHWKPLVITDWPRRRNLRAHSRGQLLNHLDVLLALDAAANCNDQRRLTEINCLFGLLELWLGLSPDFHVNQIDLKRRHLRGRFGGLCLVRAIRTGLKRNQNWRHAGHPNIGTDLALKDLPSEKDLAPFRAKPHAVGDEGLAKRRCQLRSKIANLISMTQNQEVWIKLFHNTFQRGEVTIGRILCELFILDRINFFEFLRSRLARYA